VPFALDQQKAGKPENEHSADRVSDREEIPRGTSPAAPPVETPVAQPSVNPVSGQILNQVLPDLSPRARDTIRGRMKLVVHTGVDASGRVVTAILDSPGPSRYFAARTLEAARQWVFQPPRIQGQDVASEWILRFALTRTATEVHPVQVSPR